LREILFNGLKEVFLRRASTVGVTGDWCKGIGKRKRHWVSWARPEEGNEGTSDAKRPWGGEEVGEKAELVGGAEGRLKKLLFVKVLYKKHFRHKLENPD